MVAVAGSRLANSPSGTREAASGAMNVTPASVIAVMLVYEMSFESPIMRKSRGPARVLSWFMVSTTWATSPAPPS